MKKLTAFIATIVMGLVLSIVSTASANGVGITGSVIEHETGRPLSGNNWPYVYVELQQNRNGQMMWVNGSNCYENNDLCPDANGRFQITSTYDGKSLKGMYLIRVWSIFHQMTTRSVDVGVRGLDLGDIQLRRMPAGFYISSIEQTVTGLTVKGRAFKTIEGPAPALVARLTYMGPGVTVPHVNFDAASLAIEWESDNLSKELVFHLALDPKLAEGSTFTGGITLQRADSGFRPYAQNYFVSVKGMPDFVGW